MLAFVIFLVIAKKFALKTPFSFWYSCNWLSESWVQTRKSLPRHLSTRFESYKRFLFSVCCDKPKQTFNKTHFNLLYWHITTKISFQTTYFPKKFSKQILSKFLLLLCSLCDYSNHFTMSFLLVSLHCSF